MTEAHYSYIAWTDPTVGLKDIAINNFYYYITDLINQYGQSTTLLILGIFLAIMTFLKTGCFSFVGHNDTHPDRYSARHTQ
jgi:ATP-binding cassette subfamily B protein/subfamily B ATP-binding cassette protein MsbA